ncbi:MAG: DUF4097 family beta strand repeat protein [Anaerolineales bacterium]|nr:DUF4097 family beta strand repeat protein [Anaerolineales bacterium]
MKTYHFEEQVEAKECQLNVYVEIGKVSIQPHDAPLIVVDAEVENMLFRVTHEQNIVHVYAEQDEGWEQHLKRLLAGQKTKATVTIYVPSTCVVQAKVTTGQLRVQGVQAPVTARVITGDAKLANLGGAIYARVVTGSLDYQGSLSSEAHSFKTTTGQVKLRLREPDAQLDARTTTGHIVCDLPLAQRSQQHHLVGSKVSGVLGKGAGRIKAQTVTGSLHLSSMAAQAA